MKDLKFALRMLLKNPGFTAVAVLSLGLGIGANTTVFCWIQNVLLRPVPGVERGERLAALTTTHGAVQYDTVSLPNLTDCRQLKEVFSGVIGSQVTPACVNVSGKLVWAYGQITTANFFDELGVKPLIGRTFLADEDQKPGGNAVLVLGERFWQNRFGGDRTIVGQTVSLNERAFTIIGVVPKSFHGTMSGLVCDFWAPVSMHREVASFGSLQVRDDHWMHTQAVLCPGVTLRQAQAAVDLLAGQLQAAYPGSNREIGLRLLPLWKAPYGGQAFMLPVLRILMAVSLGVLLIVAANVANLLLARATSRRKEIAIRLAIGASRARLVRQLMTESVVLALAGALIGVILANWGVQLFQAMMPKTHLPIGYNFAIDRQTLGFTILLAVLTSVIFGLVPALQTSRSDLSSSLKEGGRTSGGGTMHHRLRSGLVISEIALALLLLVGAGLCIKGFEKAKQINVGFNPDHILIAGLRVGMHGYDESRALVFYRQLRERLKSTPGIEEVALASWFPLGFEGGPGIGVKPEGYVRQPNEDMTVPFSIVSPGYFSTLRIPLLEGREFQTTDDTESQRVAIINETFAKRFWPNLNPLGRKITTWRGELTVVGVAKAGKYRTLSEPARDFIYLPSGQGAWDLNLGVALRAKGDPNLMFGALREAIHRLDPRVEIWASMTMAAYIRAAFFAQAITATMLSGLGLIALLLAGMGIYGVMAYVVSQRIQEIGIRMALGARASDVLGLMVRHGMSLGFAGVGVGLVGSLAVTRLLASFLYGVSPFDLVTFLATSLLLCLVILLASLLPAWRAARVDPQIALRSE